MFIGHVNGKLCIIYIEFLIFISNEAPMQMMFTGILFECTELIANLQIDILVFPMAFSALGFDNPDFSILFHNNVICIKKPLVLQAVQIDNRKILLSFISVFIDPVNIPAPFTMLFKELL